MIYGIKRRVVRALSFSVVAFGLAWTAAPAAAVPIVTWLNENMTSTTPDTIVRNSAGGYKYVAGLNVGGTVDTTASPDATVNGVLFSGALPTTVGSTDNQSVTSNGVTIQSVINNTGDAGSGFNGDTDDRYDPNLENVMQSLMTSAFGNGTVVNLRFNGLTPGRQYRVQFLMDQSGANGRTMTVENRSLGVGLNPSDIFSVGDTAGHGQSVIGTFTADASVATQFTFQVREDTTDSGNGRGVLNGVALFTVVPEPSTFALASFSLFGLGAIRRRKHSRC